MVYLPSTKQIEMYFSTDIGVLKDIKERAQGEVFAGYFISEDPC
jgi:hypothetical protein